MDLHAVLFVSRGRQRALPGTSACHLRLNVGLGEVHAGRAAVDDAADRAAVGFTVAGVI